MNTGTQRTAPDAAPGIDAPEGLKVTLTPEGKSPFAYFADCQAHDHCRENTLMRWCAVSWEDLHIRVFILFLGHCQDMEMYA